MFAFAFFFALTAMTLGAVLLDVDKFPPNLDANSFARLQSAIVVEVETQGQATFGTNAAGQLCVNTCA